jgi:MoxR-like ATPase
MLRMMTPEEGWSSELGVGSASSVARPIGPQQFRGLTDAIEQQISAVVVGQRQAVRGALICLVAGGHALLEGVPGVGKTTLVRALAASSGLAHGRVQFTPDLMPADITGTTVLIDEPGRGSRLEFAPGPVFTGMLLADEINRASPRTQSALLEAMQEGQVTIGGVARPLPRPFCVLATQNPVEQHGTYPLPEAQLDRFLLKLRFDYPDADDLSRIVSDSSPETTLEGLTPLADDRTLLEMNALARTVPVSSQVTGYLTRLLLALQPGHDTAPASVRESVRLGPSPRGGHSLMMAARVSALLDGRPNVALRDIRELALPALRHRVILSFDGERAGVSVEELITDTLAGIAEDASF